MDDRVLRDIAARAINSPTCVLPLEVQEEIVGLIDNIECKQHRKECGRVNKGFHKLECNGTIFFASDASLIAWQNQKVIESASKWGLGK